MLKLHELDVTDYELVVQGVDQEAGFQGFIVIDDTKRVRLWEAAAIVTTRRSLWFKGRAAVVAGNEEKVGVGPLASWRRQDGDLGRLRKQ